mmetsp:Transcript_125911/g.403093  ORF Transcript_125911/g.403093 Transcript_125911/m.403093 type:complete len:206 (+) Transcript_125911:1380-1997(+)
MTRRVPRDGEVSLEDGLLSLRAELARPFAAKGAGVGHSPSPAAWLPSPALASSPFGASSARSEPLPSRQPADPLASVFEVLSLSFLSMSFSILLKEPTLLPSPWVGNVNDSFLAVRPKRLFSSSSRSHWRSPDCEPRNCSVAASRWLVPCSHKETFCWYCARRTSRSSRSCRCSRLPCSRAWRRPRTSSSRSRVRASMPAFCFAD